MPHGDVERAQHLQHIDEIVLALRTDHHELVSSSNVTSCTASKSPNIETARWHRASFALNAGASTVIRSPASIMRLSSSAVPMAI